MSLTPALRNVIRKLPLVKHIRLCFFSSLVRLPFAHGRSAVHCTHIWTLLAV